jgi:putative transposase
MGRRAFRRSVADASLGELRRQLTYKAEWQGRTLSVVDRFYPSSKTCSTCGEVNAALKLEQHWTCACGAVHDRDVNAAKNLLREGLRVLEGAATPRSGAYARGEADAAGDSTPSPATARSTNRELISRPRKRSTPGTARKDRARAGAG